MDSLTRNLKKALSELTNRACDLLERPFSISCEINPFIFSESTLLIFETSPKFAQYSKNLSTSEQYEFTVFSDNESSNLRYEEKSDML